jgi:hypothetical protein
MKKIVLYCKSYNLDLDRVLNLAKSIEKYNIDKIPFYVSVPKVDLVLFTKKLGTLALVIEDESIQESNTQGWVLQQVIKSNFWKLGLCENYVCIDSDSYFIKPFYESDFVCGDTPYTVMHEQKELFSWSSNRSKELGFNPKDGFKNDRQKVMSVFGREGRYYDFGPSPTIWSSKVWKSLEDKYLIPNNITFESLLEHSASEFSWYGESLLAFKDIEILPIEPIFKVFHYAIQYVEYKNEGVLQESISENYMGIIMQSNWGAPLNY